MLDRIRAGWQGMCRSHRRRSANPPHCGVPRNWAPTPQSLCGRQIQMSTEEDGVLRRCAMGVAAAVLLLAAGCTSPGDAADTTELVVAASLELTGSSADVGAAHERGLRLKMEQLNSSGLLRGRRLRLVVQDNHNNAATAEGQAAKFAADPAVTAIVMGRCSECAIQSAPIANDKAVPLISLAPASQVTTPPESRRVVFKNGPDAPAHARALGPPMGPARAPTPRPG